MPDGTPFAAACFQATFLKAWRQPVQECTCGTAHLGHAREGTPPTSGHLNGPGRGKRKRWRGQKRLGGNALGCAWLSMCRPVPLRTLWTHAGSRLLLGFSAGSSAAAGAGSGGLGNLGRHPTLLPLSALCQEHIGGGSSGLGGSAGQGVASLARQYIRTVRQLGRRSRRLAARAGARCAALQRVGEGGAGQAAVRQLACSTTATRALNGLQQPGHAAAAPAGRHAGRGEWAVEQRMNRRHLLCGKLAASGHSRRPSLDLPARLGLHKSTLTNTRPSLGGCDSVAGRQGRHAPGQAGRWDLIAPPWRLSAALFAQPGTRTLWCWVLTSGLFCMML